jgi:photosystem II stability/assembly factor-like uncharacterized protein
MRRDDVRRALDALAADAPEPTGNAASTIARGRRRIRQRRVALVGVVAGLVAAVAAVGVIAHSDNGPSRVSSVPDDSTTTTPPIAIPPPTTAATPASSEPVPIPMAWVSATEGWLCTDPVLYTTDAGASWKNIDVPGPPVACAALPGGNAWVLTPSPDRGRQQLVHISRDGAAEGFAFPELPNSLVVQELTFVDLRHGFAFARELIRGPERALLETRDGGQTWELKSTESFGDIHFASDTDGWAAQVPNQTAALLHTANGGRTWSEVPVPWPHRGTSGVALAPAAVRGNTIVALGSDIDGHLSRIFVDVSTDGGRTWSMRDGPPDTVFSSSEPVALGVTDADHWQLGGVSKLWTTSDGGRTWTQVAELAGVSSITSVAFLTPGVGFVAARGIAVTYLSTEATEVLRTTDGGASWTIVDSQSNPQRPGRFASTPGGAIGCPTHPLAAPPPGDPPAGLVDAATKWVEDEGGTVASIDHTYRVGTDPGGTFGSVFTYNVGSCGPSAVAYSWVVELHGPIGQGGGGSTDQTQLVLANSPDGWHVFGRYH